jgi:hypothetical protein
MTPSRFAFLAILAWALLIAAPIAAHLILDRSTP